MKILFFVQKFLSKSETFILHQVNWFKERHQVKILCTKIEVNFDLEHDIRVIPFTKNIINKFSHRFLYVTHKNRLYANSINSYIQKENPDIIHCHFGIQALILLDNLNDTSIPVFVTFHGYDTKKYLTASPAYRRKWKRLFLQTNIFPIFVCDFHKKLFTQHKIISDNSTLLYNGVSLNHFKRTKYPNTNSFVQVSRFTEKKGHIYSIKAFEKFHKSYPQVPFTLCFIGDGELLDSIKKYLTKSPIKSHVRITNWLNQKALIQELQNHKFYIQHSLTTSNGDIEATSVSILEAMSMEMPILSSYHAGIPETIDDGVNGVLVQEKDVDAFSQSIKKILSWSYLDINRERVKKRFDIEKRNAHLEQHYIEALAKTKN